MKHPLADKTLYLLDMDGTIYLENDLIDGAADFINWLRDTGRDYVFLTNNSSKSADAYLEKLARLNIPADRSNMFTSGQAACIFLNDLKPGAKLYVVGTESLKAELRANGFAVAEGLEDDIDFLLVGYDTELTYQKLVVACELLTRDVPFYATNPDWVCPAQKGKYLPDCHTMCDMLERATGKAPFYIGKPRKEMALAAIKFKGGDPAKTALVGDRLYTDIKCGLNAGITSVFVLSGEGTVEDIEKFDVHPDVTLNSVKDIINCDKE